MIQFPETVAREWASVAHIINARASVKKRIDRGVQVETAVEKMKINHEAKILFQQELDTEMTPNLIIGTLAEYLAQPNASPSDLIEGVAKDKGLCILLGPSGAGKTTLALQMVHSILTGDDWLGQKVDPIIGSAGVMSYDQDATISANWMSRAGTPVDRVSMVNANGMGNPLGVPKFREQIVNAWRAAKVEVVVIDSFSASFVGHDQNDAGATQAYYRDMKQFALTEVGAKTLIVIVHSTDNNPLKPRGSTVHKDVADSIVAVTVEPTLQRKIQMAKYRAGLNQKEMTPVIVGKPDDVTHLVSLDPGAMSLAGLPIPPSVGATMFPPLPATHETPDTESEEEEASDL